MLKYCGVVTDRSWVQARFPGLVVPRNFELGYMTINENGLKENYLDKWASRIYSDEVPRDDYYLLQRKADLEVFNAWR